MQLRTPAKINLGLRITGKRPDGYHVLHSLFVAIGLYDVIDIEVGEAGAPGASLDIALEGPFADALQGPDNLVLRALRVCGVGAARVRLTKNIPVAAGLGGGSSDAAAVLAALWKGSPEDCRRAALGLGADVPYFLDARPRFVTGVGEVLGPECALPDAWALLVKPPALLPTARVFAAFADPLTPQDVAASCPRSFAALEALKPWLVNDLEPTATRLVPEIAGAKEALLRAGAQGAVLSGSGPTVVGLFASRQQGREAARKLTAELHGFWMRLVPLLT